MTFNDRDHELPDADQGSETMATRAVIAERDHLRAALCHADIVRHLLTVITAQHDLSDALQTLNATLQPLTGVEITAIATVDLDAATTLDADLLSAHEEILIDDWQTELSRCSAPRPAQHDGHTLFPAIHDHRVVGVARTTPTTLPIGKEVATALRRGLGEAIHLAQPST